MQKISKTYVDQLAYKVIGCCIEVHKELGPGLLESVYQKCLSEEFAIQNLNFKTEFLVPIIYKSKKLKSDLRADFLIEDLIVLEIKSKKELSSIDQAQTLGYMKLLKSPKAILVNFNCANIVKKDCRTFVSEHYRVLD